MGPEAAVELQEPLDVKGVMLLAIYSLGLAVPFLLTSLGLIALGVLLVFGRFTMISNYLSFLNRLAL